MRKWLKWILIASGVLLVLCIIIAIATGEGEETEQAEAAPTNTVQATATVAEATVGATYTTGPTDTPIPTNTTVPTDTPKATDTPEPTPTPEPFASGGLGMSKSQWEEDHTETGSESGTFVEYDDGAYLVLFVGENIQYLEPMIEERSIEEARNLAETLIPDDSQFVETYTPEGMGDLMIVDLYHSEALTDRFSENWFIGGEPGSFTVVYTDDDTDGQIETMLIATGNNP